MWRAINFIYSVYEVYALGPTHAPLDSRSPLHQDQTKLIRDIGLWHRYLLLFITEGSKKPRSREDPAVMTMLMYYHVVLIWVSTCIDQTHMINDRYTDHFEKIVLYAERLVDSSQKVLTGQKRTPFSFEMGLVPPLYFTGYRCRHPLIRRKAVDLMRRAPEQEALFATEWNAMVVEKIIELEETAELAESVKAGRWDGTFPKEEDRCQDANIHYELDGSNRVMPEVVYIRRTYRDADQKLQYARGQIPLF